MNTKINAATAGKEIELSLNDRFPKPVKLRDDSGKLVGIYQLVKTKKDTLMLQK